MTDYKINAFYQGKISGTNRVMCLHHLNNEICLSEICWWRDYEECQIETGFLFQVSGKTDSKKLLSRTENIKEISINDIRQMIDEETLIQIFDHQSIPLSPTISESIEKLINKLETHARL